jgi:putative transposase
MVDAPGSYAWSSFNANACGAADDLIVRHRVYLDLGFSTYARLRSYRSLFDTELPQETVCLLRRGVSPRPNV